MKEHGKQFLSSLVIAAFLLMLSSAAMAQFPGMGGGGGGKGNGQGAGMSQIAKLDVSRVFGKVVDSKTKKPVEFASAALLKFNKDSAVAGQFTNTKGEFNLDNLPFGTYRMRVTFIGYNNFEKQVNLSPQNSEVDLGNIVLEENTKELKQVDVTAERQNVQLAVDRKVFNVDKDVSSRGGTGMDVMKNIPGVTVDDQGNVTLRNNTPQVYVDGKPTTLTLDQIPSDQIERVEVMTNPSAKFEAAAGGGIINVILKHNEKPGYNGIATATIGTNDQYNGMFLINLREKKFGLMLTYTANGATNSTHGFDNFTFLDTLSHKPTGFKNQDYQNISKRAFQFARIGMDFYISNHNTLSLTGNGVFGNFSTTQLPDIKILDASQSEVTRQTGYNYSNTAFQNYTANIDLKHTYTTPGKEWTLTLSYNHSKGNGTSLDTLNTYLPNGALAPPSSSGPFWKLINDGNQTSDMFTGQWDFTHPLANNVKLEYGLRSNYTRTYSTVNISDDTSSFILPNTLPFDTAQSSVYRIDNLINAGYVTVGQHVHAFSYQVGLRYEESLYRGTIAGKNETFLYEYPATPGKFYQGLFPSMYLSQKFGDKHEIQINLTRKMSRPNFRQINPFKQFTSPNTYSEGNPQLQPEFQDQGEINYNLTLAKVNWLSSVYARYEEQPISGYNKLLPGANPLQDTVVSAFTNGKSSFRYGWENTVKINAVKNLDITLDGNVFYNTQDAIDSSEGKVKDVRNSGYSWFVKAIVNYKFPQAISVQVNGSYEAPRIVPQGTTRPVYYFDISVSKELGIATLNFTISDVLNSRGNGNNYDTPSYMENTLHRRDTRYAKLGVTFKFGKMDSSVFSKLRKMKKDKDKEQNSDSELPEF